MEGAALAAKRKQDKDIFLAWHVAAFTGATQSKKGLQPLAKYLVPSRAPKPQSASEMLQILRDIKGMGAPMKISQVN